MWRLRRVRAVHKGVLVGVTLCSLLPAPGAPSFLAFSEITSTTLNVSWGEPVAANGVLQGYRVVYEPLAPVQGKTRRTWGGHQVYHITLLSAMESSRSSEREGKANLRQSPSSESNVMISQWNHARHSLDSSPKPMTVLSYSS